MRKKLSIYKRLISPTPKFFKKIRKVGIILTTISVIVLAGNSQFNLELPSIVDKIGQIIAYGGFIAATISSLAVEKEEENKIHKQGYEQTTL